MQLEISKIRNYNQIVQNTFYLGSWIWVCFGGTSKYTFNIKGNPIRYTPSWDNNSQLLEITKDGFGFKSSGCILKPTTIRPDLAIIKFTRNNDDHPCNTSFWVKKIDESVRIFFFFNCFFLK